MDFTGWEKLIAAIGTAIAAMLTPIGVMYAASVGRKNKVSETTIASLMEEITDANKERDEFKNEAYLERKSGNRWYQLVMVWFNSAHDMRREALSARHVAEELAKDHDLPKLIWDNPLVLPLMEDPIPKEPS